jgi:hypothetical protein
MNKWLTSAFEYMFFFIDKPAHRPEIKSKISALVGTKIIDLTSNSDFFHVLLIFASDRLKTSINDPYFIWIIISHSQVKLLYFS